MIDDGPRRDACTLSRGGRHECAAGVYPPCEERVARETMRYRNAAEPYYLHHSAAVRRIERGLSHKQSPWSGEGGRREIDAVSGVARVVGKTRRQNRQVSQVLFIRFWNIYYHTQISKTKIPGKRDGLPARLVILENLFVSAVTPLMHHLVCRSQLR